MATVDEILKQAQSLNDNKKYSEAIKLLTYDVLETYQNADLYAEKALAYWRIKEYVLCFETAESALSLDAENSKALSLKGACYWEEKKYDIATDFFNKAITYDPYSEQSYIGLGNVNVDLKDYDKAISFYNKAIEIAPNSPLGYHALGNAYFKSKDYDKAITLFNKALKIDPELVNTYSNLGSLYRQTKQYVKSIDFYTKAIEIDPLFIQAYNGLGNVYADINEYEKAIDIFNRAQKIDPKYAALYFNRARVFQFIDEYEKAISDYKKRIELSKGRDDYYASLAKSKINDLLKILKNPEYSDISEIVEKVRKLLLYTEECVTHYTGFSVAKILILENSKFRLSEGTYLNDTSEGRELFKFLPPILTMHVDGDTIAQPFASKPFIGSFVSETKHDDLTLWRMYGKEDKVEARGCAITIERDKFLENIKDSLVTDYKNNTEKIDEEFSFFKVAYRKRDEKDYFIIPGASKKDEKDLNSLMSDLLIKVEVFVKEADDKSKKNLIGLLNSIAFLFKSAEYQYEHELRLIVKGTGINKIVDESFTPPKVYIELIGINPLIKKVTFGPKVERVDEWASAFYYKLDQRGFNPDIFISHLPFK